jgi:N6-adenosine-specific RNA methylase IME4
VSTVRWEECPPEPALWHEYANLFPMLIGPELEAFREDVRLNGVREPIVFLDGYVLDGRNRYMAARDCHQSYPRIDYEGEDPLGFVISLNLKRRHLTESQRATVAAKLETTERGRPGKDANLQVSREQAAQLLNVSERSVASASRVLEHGAPELVAAVEKGEVSVSAAADVASLPEPEQREIVAHGEKAILEAAKNIRAERVEKKRVEKIAATQVIAERNAELPVPERKYSVIYADPPWSYEVWSGAGKDRAAENHYPTMDLDAIKALPVERLAAEDCALFLWAVMPQLPEAIEVLRAWGFEYKTCAFVWVKTTQDGERPATGMGYWTRSNAEICLLATKGAPMRMAADVHQVVQTPRMEHSRKPDEVAERIERLVPGPYIELFSRRAREGWDAWGNQAESADVA